MADTKTVSPDKGSTLPHPVPTSGPTCGRPTGPTCAPASSGRPFYLVVAKLVLVVVPYFFKWATDALSGGTHATPPLPDFLLAPAALVIAYNVVRIVQLGFNQLRDALFARVGQYAVRQLAYRTFVHMHELSLRFHLERRTGGLSRIIERGTKGIETIVRFTILNTLPTILEFALTAVIFAVAYGFVYVAVVAVTVALYTWFTVWASDWRISIRRDMNESDTDANTKAIDSLLNYETVKYFGNETMEAARFDKSMARYEIAATRTWTSLGWLNFGQGVIFGLGMVVVMVLSAREVMAGTQTIGDFVFINAMLMQLSVPLNFIGFIYREIRQGLTDIEQMFDLLDVHAGDRRQARRQRLSTVAEGKVEFRDVHFSYDPNRAILKGVSFDGAGRQDGRHRRPVRRRQVDHLAPAVPLLRHPAGPDPRSTARTSATSRRRACAPPSAWSRRTRCCSTTRSPTTSATAASTPRKRT